MRKYYVHIIIIEIILLVVLIIVGRNQDKESEISTSDQKQNQYEGLESIFTILPYEEEGIAIYYFDISDTFEIQIKKAPYDRNLEYALSILHKYKETQYFTKDDVRVVAPSYMYRE